MSLAPATSVRAAALLLVLLLLLAVPGRAAMAACDAAEPAPPGDKTDTVGNTDDDGDGVQNHRDRCRAPLPGGKDVDEIGCPTAVDPFAEVAFDDATHRGWYDRYWTGTCDRVPNDEGERSKCRLAKFFWPDYWFETVDIVVGRVPVAERPVIRFDLWRLGRLIGHEWARANEVRLIHSPDIKRWRGRLRNAAPQDVCAEIRALFAAARAKLEGG